MTEEEIDRMADNFVNIQDFTRVYSVARKAECGAFWKYGFLAGLKAGKPQWHDLRKEPNDLPKEFDKPYLCYVNGHFEVGYYMAYKEQPWHFDEYYLDNEDVDAWCEIPQFKDKE